MNIIIVAINTQFCKINVVVPEFMGFQVPQVPKLQGCELMKKTL
jgi:hypothetical protein